MKSSFYLIFAVIFLASMVFYNWFKQNSLRKEFKKFDKNDILMYTYGVYYYGVESEKGKILNSQGLMILLKNGLYYKGSLDKRQLFIPEGKLYSIVVTDFHKGELTYKECLAFYFENEKGEVDRAAFSIPHPKDWVDRIREVLAKDKNIIIHEELLEK
ncbi:MAG TPA: hypothetical protein PKJ39_02675 [Caldisericia bacterium]|nr:hypothetical protein [Caldisericia bacterium]HQL66638.1 hypothetical protein [Caldisericia bacterium]